VSRAPLAESRQLQEAREGTMRIKLTSIMVDDQNKALRFYTEVLGFQKQQDFPVVGEYRWITVAAADRDDLQLSLEPNANPAAKTFQAAMFEQGIPLASFEVTDIAAEFKRLTAHGVVFTVEPTRNGPVSIAVFSDTCGNLIQLHQVE
jgi:predicted enzyme related to lactoylglutathione lyase